jgi:hypothetical protein
MCDESWKMCLEEKKRNRSVYIGIDDDSTVREFEWATVQQNVREKNYSTVSEFDWATAIVA